MSKALPRLAALELLSRVKFSTIVPQRQVCSLCALSTQRRPVARIFATRRGYATTSAIPPNQQVPPQTAKRAVKIVEVGARDGLQNEKTVIPLETKLALVEKLAGTGLEYIEAASFVSPKWVPQMASSAEMLENILKHKLPTMTAPPSRAAAAASPSTPTPITYSFLAPNMKGLEMARTTISKYPESFTPANAATAGATADKPKLEVAVFAAATESFSQKNLNCSVEQSLENFRPVVAAAKELGLGVRGYVSVVLGCPFEGYDTDPHKVAQVATALLEMGADEVSLGDTTGMGTAPRTQALLRCLIAAGIRTSDLAMHFHDTYGQALINTAVSLEHGIRTFDSSIGGLGGCPYSPGATGNIATENMVYFLESLGMSTGVDLDRLADIGKWISGELNRPNDSAVGKALLGVREKNLKGKL